MSEKRVHFGQDAPFNWTEGLELLCKDIPNREVMVEIGCFAGISTEVFARHFGKVYAVDTWAPYEEVTEPNVIQEARRMFFEGPASLPNVVVIEKQSPGAASMFGDLSLDFVYVDANHSFYGVMADLVAWYPKVKIGGYIGGHDYHQPGVYAAVAHVLDMPRSLYPDTSWIKHKEG